MEPRTKTFQFTFNIKEIEEVISIGICLTENPRYENIV